MSDNLKQGTLFEMKKETQTGPVTCLGLTFETDEARRAYFREELRKKLPDLRKLDGFPIGEDEDILALSDPPFYTACPNPWLNSFIEECRNAQNRLYGVENKDYHKEPFVANVHEGRNEPIYNAHNYHTKVPHKAIMRFILHYTEPGDIVFDGFCGTGMTGVAAEMCGNKAEVESLGYKVDGQKLIYKKELNNDGNEVWIPFSKLGARRAILNDLSPVATFITYNYNSKVNTNNLLDQLNRVFEQFDQRFGWIYSTLKETSADKATKLSREFSSLNSLSSIKDFFTQNAHLFEKTNYIIWSDVLACPSCSHEMVLWEVTIEQNSDSDNIKCTSCNMTLSKSKMERIWETEYDNFLDKTIRVSKKAPTLINYKVGKKVYTKKPDEFDIALIKKLREIDLNKDIPVYRMPEGDEARRNDKTGITHTHQFYTRRNLLALSEFWSHSKNNKLLKLALTSVLLKTGSLLHNVGIKKGSINLAGALPNSLYIPGNIAERNIVDLLRGKVADIVKAELDRRSNDNLISCMSLGKSYASTIGKNQLDYIFIDPPFGANLMYSELNFLWESWLRVFTNNKMEAIENKTQQKTIAEYRVLMTEAFKSAYDLLKPGRWMTVEFSNTKAVVWNAIQSAIQEAGFIIANVAALNKGQGTYNSQTNPTSVTQDLVISAYKPTELSMKMMLEQQNTEESAWTFVKEYLAILPSFKGQRGSAELIIERTPRILFDRMVAYHVQNGYTVPISSADFQIGIEQRFPMRDGMAFLETQIAEYDKKRTLAKEFAQLSLFVSDENSAIEWLRQQLIKKPQTRQDLQPNFMKEIQHIAKYEQLPELDVLLEQNFLRYDENGEVPSQIHTYLSTDYKDLRNLNKNDPALKLKAKDRWYVPDPNKQADLEKLREKSLLREFETYRDELIGNRKKLKQFRTEAIRAGFKKAWGEKDYQTIVTIGERLPENVLQEDDKLLMYYDNAQIRLGL